MMKEHHLKRYIDRLMMVPRAPMSHAHGEKNPPIDLPGSKLPNEETPEEARSLFDEAEGEKYDQSGLMHIADRDTMPEEPHSMDHRDDHMEGEKIHTPKVADSDDHENPMGKSAKGLMHQKNPIGKDHKAMGSGLHKVAGKSGSPKPQSVMEPHASLSPEEHEKKVKSERERHAKIFGGY